MFKNIKIPPSFSLVEKGKVSILLKEEYKKLFLEQGIVDFNTYLKKNDQISRYLKGRTPHPVIPLGDGKNIVLRQYSHGGLLRNITGKIYLFGSRSFRELALTEEIRSSGIPTILSIGAVHQKIFFSFHKAYIFSLEVPSALDMIQYFDKIGTSPSREKLSQKRKIIRQIGSLIRQFHQTGFFHSDLQLKNILIAGDQILLIDFDRSYRKQNLTIQKRIKNLFRLNRSVEKWKRLGLLITRTDGWRFFLAYAGDDEKIKGAMIKALRTYPLRSLFYRFGWAIENIVRS